MAVKNTLLESQLEKWSEKLQDLRHLRLGWDGYDAPVPTGKSLEKAAQFLESLKQRGDLEPALLSPSTVGGVGITFAGINDREAYLEFFNDGRVFAALSNGHEEPHIFETGTDDQPFSFTLQTIWDYLHG